MRGQRPLRARLAAVPLPARAVATGGAAVVVAVAALALRLGGLGDVAPDPFYDAAVRSMGLSWHNFLFGALEPGGSVSIDKPAVALWPQVATTRLLGFSTATLVLPSALAGLAAVALLQRLAAMLWGRAAGWAAAAALAVAPLAVLTDRSDTMDSLAVALSLVAAVALVAATGAEERDASAGRWLIAAAGAAVGAGFAVKLFQGLIPVPALALLYVAASPLGWGERLSRLVLWTAVGTAVGLSWFLVVSTAPGREQPWAYGSHDGTALSAAFVYDGLGRLAGPASGAAANDTAPVRRTSTSSCSTRPTLLSSPAGGCPVAPAGAGDLAAAAAAPPGPTRLISKHADLRGLLGVELLPALVIGGLALVLGWRAGRLPRAGAIFIAAWLLTGVAVLSFLPDLKVRYVDVLAPPVAAALGVGLISLTQRKAIGAVLLAVLLAAPATQAVRVVQQRRLGLRSPRRAHPRPGDAAQRLSTTAHPASALRAGRRDRRQGHPADRTRRPARPDARHAAGPRAHLAEDPSQGRQERRGPVRLDQRALRTARRAHHDGLRSRGAVGEGARPRRVGKRAPGAGHALRAHPRLSARRYPRSHTCKTARWRSSSSTTSRRYVKR